LPAATILENLREAWEVPRDLLLGRYPSFVTGGPLPRGHVPVFVFHSLERSSFERKARHLAENGYVTLSADEYLAVIGGDRPAPERAVLLTFDDGRRSLWTVGRPILERYGLRGVVFLVPGRMTEATPPAAPGEATDDSPPLVDNSPGRAEALLTWQEVMSLRSSGLLSFHSHTLTHARIHVSPTLSGFVTPEMRRGYRALDLPAVRIGGSDIFGEEVPLGTPLFASLPRLAEALRFFEDEGIRARSVDAVARAGGEAFFRHPGWRSSLRRALGRLPPEGRWETAQERVEAVRRELFESRRLIEERVGQSVALLCYPWHTFGPTAVAVAREAGYRGQFGGKLAGLSIALAGGDPERIPRVGEDYLELLPGRGRQTLGSVLRTKWGRRFSRRA
jgi:peptidoglycan/xylan/chitin deacetylase (PgdA/CDA1 family)